MSWAKTDLEFPTIKPMDPVQLVGAIAKPREYSLKTKLRY